MGWWNARVTQSYAVRTQCVREWRALSVCVCVCCGACGDTLLLPRVGRLSASESLGGASATGHTQPSGSTRTHRRRGPHMHQHTTQSLLLLFHQPFRGGELLRAPLGSAQSV